MDSEVPVVNKPRRACLYLPSSLEEEVLTSELFSPETSGLKDDNEL